MNISKEKWKQLAPSDLELVARLSERIHYTNPREPFLNHAFVILNEAFPCTIFSVDSYSVDPLCFKQAISVGPSTELYALYRKYLYQHPLIKVLASAPSEPCVATILTQTSRKAFHQTDLYQKFYHALGIEDQLILYLPHPNGVYVVVYSRDTAFSEKEQTIMQLLQPQLQIALKNWRHIRELEQHMRTLTKKTIEREPSSQQVSDKARLLDRLTPRQKAVAEQVAQGLENREIAEVLHISPKTVGKHIENIFETLNMHHRAALAVMWRQCNPAE